MDETHNNLQAKRDRVRRAENANIPALLREIDDLRQQLAASQERLLEKQAEARELALAAGARKLVEIALTDDEDERGTWVDELTQAAIELRDYMQATPAGPDTGLLMAGAAAGDCAD